MNRILEFVRTTLVGGFLFLLPVVLAVVVLQHGIRLAARLLKPIAHLFPGASVLGIATADLLAIALLLFICFAAGLIAKTKIGAGAADRLERIILRKMPGFNLIKSAAQGLTNAGANPGIIVALARIDDAWLLAFIVERHENGMLTVFVPSAPTPAAGTIYYLLESQVRRLDVPLAEAVKCIMQLGAGSKALLEKGNAFPPSKTGLE